MRSGSASSTAAAAHDNRDLGDLVSFDWVARVGLVARGLVYAVIGMLALKLAIGDGGSAQSQRGALETVSRQPFGEVLLIALAAGLAAYATWQATIAFAGSPGEDDKLHRVAGAGGAVAYSVICVTAIKILIGAHTSGASTATRNATAGVLGWPAGPAIVVAAGAIIVGVGLYQGYKGLGTKFLEDAETGKMSRVMRRVYTALGVVGYAARAIIFALIGYGLIKAAIDYQPNKAIGLDGALRNLANSSYGPALLGCVAAGFIAFGLFSILDARYHRVD